MGAAYSNLPSLGVVDGLAALVVLWIISHLASVVLSKSIIHRLPGPKSTSWLWGISGEVMAEFP